ncbi:hypothetical protein L207DRAFT_500390 [Hyaloscypha variabilis F]|uniref:Uncharacterized protein n=1 Tax=Hyaloscypha variabilis (strain UAMH 11265 / GT02V1 / F) TaxID=1149755 RepID=A0A2J6R0K3_HYAVF|nr:hypothetical protein L207DRAFT_500390 [Hyaloscypha variabilis F]
MLAARDQENLVHGHHQAAASKPLNQSTRGGLQPKTPGNKYPKTPLKIPLNDENAPTGFGKSIKGKGLENLVTGKKSTTFDKNAFITPMGPKTRAPLGMKTTNAKTKAFQTPGPALEKEVEKTQPKQTSTRKPKKVIHADSVKLEVHGDESPLAEREVEYCPPKPKDLPYDSEDFPNGCLDYNVLKKGNLMRGIYKTYYNDLDENGMSRQDYENEEAYQKSAAKADEQIRKMMEEEWTVDDVPETFRHLRKKQVPSKEKTAATAEVKKVPAVPSKGPATIASRKAASALSVLPKSAPAPPKATKPTPKPSFLSRAKPTPAPTIPSNASTMRHAAAIATSRSTIGYTKGRSAFTQVQKTERSGLTRSISNLSQGSDTTITPERFFAMANEQESRSPAFLKAFEVDDEDLEPGLRGIMPECLRRPDDDDEEFVFTLGVSEPKE